MNSRDRILQELASLALHQNFKPDFLVQMKSLTDADFVFLAESIDDSDYSLTEWCLALHEFWMWLNQHARTLPPRGQIEYLNCCVQGAVQGGGKLLSLKDLFLDYVGVYGVHS